MAKIFLASLEKASKSGGHYAASIAGLKEKGAEVPGIMHLLAFKPNATDHLNQFTQQVMRGPSPLSPAFRELIATITSESNECDFCRDSHAMAAAQLFEAEGRAAKGKGEKFVLGALDGSTNLTEAEWALLEFVVRVNEDAQNIEKEEIEDLVAAGWSEEAIYDAIAVCSLFNFYNRFVGANGVSWDKPASSKASGIRIAQRGYIP